jgi:transcriptional regulator GlxA family with amidase domain
MQIAIGLYPGFTALDWVGPYDVFGSTPGTDVVLCAAEAGLVGDESGRMQVQVEHTFSDVPQPDVLLVPGGFGSRRVGVAGSPIVEWVLAAHPHTRYTTSVCTGALVLGATGLLDGLTATTHWRFYEHLRAFGANPVEQRVVFQDRIVTGAGVSAGIDLALALTAELHGPEMAQAVQLGIEYDPQPPFDTGAPSKAPAEIRDLVAAAMADAEAKAVGSP